MNKGLPQKRTPKRIRRRPPIKLTTPWRKLPWNPFLPSILPHGSHVIINPRHSRARSRPDDPDNRKRRFHPLCQLRERQDGHMVRVTIDAALKTKCPRTALACVMAHVVARASAEALIEVMKAREAEIQKLPHPRGVLASSQVEATRSAYKALGKDPARYRGSAEALLRRIVAGRGLPQINAVVDVINLVSVESRLPIGLYDLAHVQSEIVFRRGRAGETYKGIGKYDLNLEGLPVFCDALGPHGSPTSDSERTMVTSETNQVLAIIISFGGKEGLERWTQRMSELFQRFASGVSLEKRITD